MRRGLHPPPPTFYPSRTTDGPLLDRKLSVSFIWVQSVGQCDEVPRVSGQRLAGHVRMQRGPRHTFEAEALDRKDEALHIED